VAKSCCSASSSSFIIFVNAALRANLLTGLSNTESAPAFKNSPLSESPVIPIIFRVRVRVRVRLC
jgi:hypothetical protein